MATRSRLFAALALLLIVVAAFFSGRAVEERAFAEKMRANSGASTLAPSPTPSGAPLVSHQQPVVADIFALPFAEFYEALRSAPGAAREKWVAELAAMPDGPRRRAAVSGFYKLLVQFDPEAAAKAISAIRDEASLRLALGAAVDSAPGFAMPLMAELTLSLQDRLTGKRDYVPDVLIEWALIDAPAVAHFIDDHKEAIDEFGRGRYLHVDEVVSIWATADPKAAKEWIDRAQRWGGWEIRKFFMEGWYENDRAAAISYALAHVEDEDMGPAVGSIVCNLYSDSKEEAAKFIESLPENKRAEALAEAFHNLTLGDEKETGDTVFTPRAIASWIIQFPPKYWHEALGRLFRFSWANAEEMLSWIQEQAPSIREPLAADYEAPFSNSPSEKVMPVLQEADVGLRDHLFRALLKNESLDFDEAMTAIGEAPLSTEQKQHFRQIIEAVKAEKERDAISEK